MNLVLEMRIQTGPTKIDLERSLFPTERTGIVPVIFRTAFYDHDLTLSVIITGIDRMDNENGREWIIRCTPEVSAREAISKVLGWHHEDDRGMMCEVGYNTNVKRGMLKVYEIPSR